MNRSRTSLRELLPPLVGMVATFTIIVSAFDVSGLGQLLKVILLLPAAYSDPALADMVDESSLVVIAFRTTAPLLPGLAVILAFLLGRYLTKPFSLHPRTQDRDA